MKQAFTLIELLVVVLIIGILSAVALPQYRKAVLKSKMAEIVILGKAIMQAEEVYKLQNGSYATTADIDSLAVSIPSKYTVGLYNDEHARANIQGNGFGWDFSFATKQASCYAPVDTMAAQVCQSITGAETCSEVMHQQMYSYCSMQIM